MRSKQQWPILRGRRLWRVILVILAGQCLLSAMSEIAQGKLARRDVGGGVAAATHGQHLTASRRRDHSAAMAAALEASMGTNLGSHRQQVYLAHGQSSAAGNLTLADSSPDTSGTANTMRVASDLSSLHIYTSQEVDANSTTTSDGTSSQWKPSRWGQSAILLPNSSVIMFAGGRTAGQSGNSTITSDVFALKLQRGGHDPSKSKSQRSTRGYTWTQLSSDGAPSHAFSAVMRRFDGREGFFIVGGSTSNCSTSSTIHHWQSGVGNDWRSGRWTLIHGSASSTQAMGLPPRRRGAAAIEVPAQLGLGSGRSRDNTTNSAFMVFGGETDDYTCTKSHNSSVAAYSSVDIWTANTIASVSSPERAHTSHTTGLDVRSLPLDLRMPNMSVVDYSAVVLPANKTAGVGTRVLFIGGRDAEGALTSMIDLWALDLETSGWLCVRTNHTSADALPDKRVGHTSTLLENGLILVHGGYTSLDRNETASAETFLLDVRQTPATWQKLAAGQTKRNINQDKSSLSRAFHSAVLVDGILVLAFGQQTLTHGHSLAYSNSSNLDKGAAAIEASNVTQLSDSANLQFLDTRRAGSWYWTSNYASLLQDRMSDTSTTQAGHTFSQTATVPHSTYASYSASQPAISVGTQTTALDSNDRQTSVAAPNESATTVPEPSQAPTRQTPDDQGSGQSSTSKTTTTTTVVASVFGAAGAIAALAVALFAFRRWQGKQFDADGASIDDSRYERFVAGSASQIAPPVSSLWINQPLPLVGAGRGSKRPADDHNERTEQHVIATSSVLSVPGRQRLMPARNDMQIAGFAEDGKYTTSNRLVSAGRLAQRRGEKHRRLHEQQRLDENGEGGDDTIKNEGWDNYLEDEDNGIMHEHAHPRTFALADDANRADESADVIGEGDFDDTDTAEARRPSMVTLSQFSPSEAVSHLSYPYLQATSWRRDREKGGVPDFAASHSQYGESRARSQDSASLASTASEGGTDEQRRPHTPDDADPFQEAHAIAEEKDDARRYTAKQADESRFSQRNVSDYDTILPWASPQRTGTRHGDTRRSTLLLAAAQRCQSPADVGRRGPYRASREEARLNRERPSLLRVTNASTLSLDRHSLDELR